jgi:hypothetical protein
LIELDILAIANLAVAFRQAVDEFLPLAQQIDPRFNGVIAVAKCS